MHPTSISLQYLVQVSVKDVDHGQVFEVRRVLTNNWRIMVVTQLMNTLKCCAMQQHYEYGEAFSTCVCEYASINSCEVTEYWCPTPSGISIRWVVPPPQEVERAARFNVSYKIEIEDHFYNSSVVVFPLHQYQKR